MGTGLVKEYWMRGEVYPILTAAERGKSGIMSLKVHLAPMPKIPKLAVPSVNVGKNPNRVLKFVIEMSYLFLQHAFFQHIQQQKLHVREFKAATS